MGGRTGSWVGWGGAGMEEGSGAHSLDPFTQGREQASASQAEHRACLEGSDAMNEQPSSSEASCFEI